MVNNTTMIKNGSIRFSLLGIFLVLLLSACSTPRYSHANQGRKSESTNSRYASNHRNKSTRTKDYKSHPSESRVKTSEVANIDKLNLRNSIVKSAEQYLGTQYVYGGKSPNPGFDCSGFTCWVFKQNGLNVNGASHQQSKLGKKVDKSKAKPGDLIFFGSGSKVSHVAIVKNNSGEKLEVIHSTSGKGVRVDDINDSDYWNKRYLYAVEVIK